MALWIDRASGPAIAGVRALRTLTAAAAADRAQAAALAVGASAAGGPAASASASDALAADASAADASVNSASGANAHSDEPVFDADAETAPDTAASASEELVRRAEILMLKQRINDQDREARLDRMRSEFDFATQQRTEFLREMNILRDMAMEQRKKDDELLKKWIALI